VPIGILTKPLADAGGHELGVSLPGTLAAGEVTDASGEQITVVSIYGAWASPIRSRQGSWIYADASVHRLISDLSALVASQRGHRIVVAGDLNVLYGHGEHGSDYWRVRYETVFTRMNAIGLSVRRSTVPERRAVRFMAVRTAKKQQECSDLSDA
jgi:hypothetical protein